MTKIGRPLARYIVCLGVLVLGWVAAMGLDVAYLPSWSFPELQVSLSFPETTELGDVTRLWIEPLEAALRSTGEMRSLAGEVDGRGGSFRVRFKAGIDIEKKAARLESELGALRRRLPSGASLRVQPRSQGEGESSMILWLDTGETELDGAPQEASTITSPVTAFNETLWQELRQLPEVSEVSVAGRPLQQIQIRSSIRQLDGQSLDQILQRQLASKHLGEVTSAGQRTSVWLRGQGARTFGEQSLRRGRAVLPLASMAELEVRQEDPPWVARHRGRQGWVIFVQRELGESPLALEQALRDVLSSRGILAHFFLNEAEPLRRLLERLAMGFFAAVWVLILGGAWIAGWRGAMAYGLALPVTLAATFNGYWLAGIPLDLTTLPVMSIALAGSLVFLLLRQGRRQALPTIAIQAVASMILPIAIALASGSLAPLLEASGRAYLVAAIAALSVLWILPVPALELFPGRGWRSILKRVLRQGWTVTLMVATVSYLLFVLAGSVLSPRPGSVPAALMDLAVFVQLPEGSTLEQAATQFETIEDHLATLEEVEDFWSVFNRQGGSLGITLRPEDRHLTRLRPLERRLQSQLGHLGAAISLVPYAGGGRQSAGPMRFDDSIEDEATFDVEEAFTYRFILRSTDLEALRQSHDRVVENMRLRRWELWPQLVRSEWRQPTVRAELVPRKDASPEEILQATQSVRRLASPSRARSLGTSGTLSLRVLDSESPQDEDDIAQRWQLMALQNPAAPLAADRYFELREALASPRIRRQGGRYVLPINLRLRGELEAGRRESAATIQYHLRKFRTDTGVDLELPDIGYRTLRRERLRLWSMAAALPVLMWILAVCRLNSFSLGSVALAPLVIALAASTPWLRSAKQNIDEMVLIGLAAALVAALPLAIEVAARLPLKTQRGGTSSSGGLVYRWLAPQLAVGTLLCAAIGVFLVVPSWGLDVDRQPWVLPLRGAAVIMVVGALASYWVLPLLLQGLQRLATRDPVVEEERCRPAVWQHPGELSFSVRHLTKVYGGTFKAMDGLDFDLRPGIVGLLGPNGAGKTTLLRLLCGLLEPTRGQVLFRGAPITAANLPEYRRLVGFLPQEFNAYEGVTAEQFLDYWALERGILDPPQRRREIAKVLADVGLSDVAGRRVRQFSGGMRRRIGIARALLGDPPIVIVDEPTTGLDVESRHRLRETLLSVAGERIIIFSTHIASDIAAAASRILLLHQGQLLYDGASDGLIESARGRVFEALLSDAELRQFSRNFRVTTRVRTLEGIRVRAVILGEQEPEGSLVTPNLEEAYLAWISDRGGGRGDLSNERAGSLLDLEAWRNA